MQILIINLAFWMGYTSRNEILIILKEKWKRWQKFIKENLFKEFSLVLCDSSFTGFNIKIYNKADYVV